MVIDLKTKKQNSENCSVFLFSDDLAGLASEGSSETVLPTH